MFFYDTNNCLTAFLIYKYNYQYKYQTSSSINNSSFDKKYIQSTALDKLYQICLDFQISTQS